MGRMPSYSDEFKQEVCDYYFENPGVTVTFTAELFGMPKNSKSVRRWIREDPRHIARHRYSEEEIRTFLSYYHDTEGATFGEVRARFGLSVTDPTLSGWLNRYPEYRKTKRTVRTIEEKRAVCEFAIAHPEKSRTAIIREFGYPNKPAVLSRWLDELYGVPAPENHRAKEDAYSRAVDLVFASEDKGVTSIAESLGLSPGNLMKHVREDARWLTDGRNTERYRTQKDEIVDYYFEHQSMTFRDVSEEFGGRPTAATIGMWVREDPRCLDPATYGFTEEQKQLALETRRLHPDMPYRKLCEEIGFPLNKRAFRAWRNAEPRTPPETSDAGRGKKRPRIPLETRVSAVEDVRDKGMSPNDVAKRYNMSVRSVGNYVKACEAGGYMALLSKEQIPKRGKNLQASKNTLVAGPDGLTRDQVNELIARNEELERRNEELQFENDVCHAIFDVLKKDPRLSKEEPMANTEKAMVINELRRTGRYKLKRLLERFGISKSSYEYAKNALERPDKYAEVREYIHEIYEKSMHAYGYRRITAVLRMPKLGENEKGIGGYGIKVDEKVVRRLMREENVVPHPAKKIRKYNSYRGAVGKVAPNILKRDFHSGEPYVKLLTDVTEFHLNNYKVYLSPVVDCFNGEAVCWTRSQSPNLGLVTEMLEGAIGKVGKRSDVLIHSDQGWPYQHPLYRQMLQDAGWTQSMSRKGCCSDNSACEGFFGRLKNEFFYNHDFTGYTPEEFMNALDEWIAWYNNERVKETLDYSSPALYRKQWQIERAGQMPAA